MLTGPQQPVHKQMPPLYVLYLVKKEMIDIAIYFVNRLKNVVQLRCVYLGKHFVVEVNVSVCDRRIHHCLSADNGFPGSPHADDRLCQRTVDFNLSHRRSLKHLLCLKTLKFKFLLLYGLFQTSAHVDPP